MSITAARGIRAAGVAAGIKPHGELDLAIVAPATPCPAAAVFTVNRAPAAPVQVSRRHLGSGQGVGAVVINSGCANAGTGQAGLDAAIRTTEAAAEVIGCRPEQVLVCSTGTIGDSLPIDAVVRGVTAAGERLATHSGAGTEAAAAMLTTDTTVKETLARADGFVVGGMAKGAGMIRPDMATLLAVVATDAIVDAGRLDAALRAAVDVSFHALNVDGCASTNDTVVVLATGESGTEVGADQLAGPLGEVCRELTMRIAADAEGAARVVTIAIRGARDDAAARHLGRAIADWALVRAAFHGGDPNWGRLLGAAGAAGVEFDPAEFGVSYAGVPVAERGVGVSFDEATLVRRLEKGDFTVNVTVGGGPGTATVITTDLTPEYVRFNAERS